MKRRSVAVCGLIAVCALVLAGCEPRDQTPVGRGRRAFQRTCSGCHGPDGRGVMRLGLTKPPRDLTDAQFHAQITDEQLKSVIRTGKGQMPAFGGLISDAELTNVIAFIRTLPPGAKAPPSPAAAVPSAAVPSAPATSAAPSDVVPAPEAPPAPNALAAPERAPGQGVVQ